MIVPPSIRFDPRQQIGWLSVGLLCCLVTNPLVQQEGMWAFAGGVLLVLGSGISGFSAPRLGPSLAGLTTAIGSGWVLLQRSRGAPEGTFVFWLVPIIVAIVSASLASKQRKRFDLLEFHRTHDELTGCLNRMGLRDAFERITSAAAADAIHGIAVLDSDHFKQFNDMHGHLAGDEFLRRVGQRLTAMNQPGMAVARWGGDEFVLAISGTEETILSAVKAAHTAVGGLTFERVPSPQWTAGLVLVRGPLDFETQLNQADQLMLRTKRDSPGTLSVETLLSPDHG